MRNWEVCAAAELVLAIEQEVFALMHLRHVKGNLGYQSYGALSYYRVH